MRIGARLLVAALLVSALLPAAGEARVRSYLLRMDGYVGQPTAKVRNRADLRLRAAGEDVRFQVTSAKMLEGNMTTSNMFAQVRPFRPNFILRGSKDQLRRVAHAPRGAVLRITGRWRPGSQELLVSSVDRQ